jgi:hypothetical protein
MSSSPKSLNIEQPENFEYRPAAWKSLNIKQPENFEYRAARKMRISISPKTLNHDQPDEV